jgi:hypothetical protein
MPNDRAEVYMSQLQNNPILCRYCGLESGVSHASGRECVDALQLEGKRLRDRLLHVQPAADSQPPSGRDHGTSESPRIALLR